MTRRHFEMFAEMLREVPSKARRLDFADRLIPVCKKANPRFDENRFRLAANAMPDEVELGDCLMVG